MTRQEIFDGYMGRIPALAVCGDAINAAVDAIINCFRGGGRVFVCGNGGSSADSAHIVGEFLKGFLKKRPLPDETRVRLAAYGEPGCLMADRLQGSLAAIDLTTQQAIMSAVANDTDPALVYAQQLWGLGRRGDILIGISTSGNARNVLCAGIAARELDMITVSMTGGDGGEMARLFDIAIKVPSSFTPEIQEYHLPVYHMICAMTEAEMF